MIDFEVATPFERDLTPMVLINWLISVVFRFMPPSDTGRSMIFFPCRASAMRSLTKAFPPVPARALFIS